MLRPIPALSEHALRVQEWPGKDLRDRFLVTDLQEGTGGSWISAGTIHRNDQKGAAAGAKKKPRMHLGQSLLAIQLTISASQVVQWCLSANAGDSGDTGLIPRSGSSPGVGNGDPLQYSCLQDSMDRGAWWATGVYGVAKSRM